jgi:hypothetical protein
MPARLNSSSGPESGQFGLLPATSLARGRPAEQSASLVDPQSTALAAKRISIFLQLRLRPRESAEQVPWGVSLWGGYCRNGCFLAILSYCEFWARLMLLQTVLPWLWRSNRHRLCPPNVAIAALDADDIHHPREIGASTCNAISVATFGSLIIRKCVAEKPAALL